MGACVVAAAALLRRISGEGHRVLPSHPELFIGAEDAMDNENKLAVLMHNDDDAVAEEPPTQARELFAALCDVVTTKAAAAFRLANGAKFTEAAQPLQQWAAGVTVASRASDSEPPPPPPPPPSGPRPLRYPPPLQPSSDPHGAQSWTPSGSSSGPWRWWEAQSWDAPAAQPWSSTDWHGRRS